MYLLMQSLASCCDKHARGIYALRVWQFVGQGTALAVNVAGLMLPARYDLACLPLQQLKGHCQGSSSSFGSRGVTATCVCF